MKIHRKYVVQHKNCPYLCTVFFMVLDLRLTMKIGCRETTFSFLCTFALNDYLCSNLETFPQYYEARI